VLRQWLIDHPAHGPGRDSARARSRLRAYRRGTSRETTPRPGHRHRTASASNTPPASDTPEPAASTRTHGYNPVVLITCKVLLDSARHGLDKPHRRWSGLPSVHPHSLSTQRP
jgi:hypothetical protein